MWHAIGIVLFIGVVCYYIGKGLEAWQAHENQKRRELEQLQLRVRQLENKEPWE